MKLELISFKLCPFVQRAVIMLNKNNMGYKITYVDLANQPQWFKEISPMGKVPVLKVDDEVLFESAVISEFINDISPNNMHPNDALIRAKNRAWIEFGSNILADMFFLTMKKDKQEFEDTKADLFEKITKIEEIKTKAKFFNGDDFCIIDAVFATIFMRISFLNEFCNDYFSIADFKNLKSWSNNLLKMKVVKNSVVDDFSNIYLQSIKSKDNYLKTLICT